MTTRRMLGLAFLVIVLSILYIHSRLHRANPEVVSVCITFMDEMGGETTCQPAQWDMREPLAVNIPMGGRTFRVYMTPKNALTPPK